MKTKGNISISAMLARILSGSVGALFLLLGVGFLTLPEVFATGFFVEPARAVGINAIRGDFGGLFLGMSVFCLLAMVFRRRGFLAVPLVFLLLIVTGRIVSVIADDVPPAAAGSILVELVLIAILALAAVMFSADRGVMPNSRFKAKELLRRDVLAGVGAVFLILVAIFSSQKEIGMMLVENLVSQNINADVIGSLPDGLHVGLSGAGSPMPDSKRVGPGVFVIAGTNYYVIDAGPGCARKLELMRLPSGRIQAVLLTHFHSDHIAELGELMLKRWASGSNEVPLEIIGPQGVQTVVQGFNLAYSLDDMYRVAHHGPNTVPPSGAGGVAKPFDFPEGKNQTVVIDSDGVKVTAFIVDHRPVRPAVGYRFEYKGRSLVISGDTLPSEVLTHNSAGVDLLLHEALQPNMVRILTDVNKKYGRSNLAAITKDILSYHTFPEEAARIAEEADVGHLVFYHIIPPLPVSTLNTAFLGEAKRYFSGPITIGCDGMLFSLPAGNKKILRKWLL